MTNKKPKTYIVEKERTNYWLLLASIVFFLLLMAPTTGLMETSHTEDNRIEIEDDLAFLSCIMLFLVFSAYGIYFLGLTFDEKVTVQKRIKLIEDKNG